MGIDNKSLYFACMVEYSHAELKLTNYLCPPPTTPTTNKEMIYNILIMYPLTKIQHYNFIVASKCSSFHLSFALDEHSTCEKDISLHA